MPKRKTIAKIDSEIARVQKSMIATKARYEKLCQELRALERQREEIEGQNLLEAYRKSKRSYDEAMTFFRD